LDPPSDQDTKPRWLQEILKDVEGHTTPKDTLGERRPPQRFSNYVALMSKIISTNEQIANILTKPLVKGKFVLQRQIRSGGEYLPPGGVLLFVASGGIPTRSRGVKHVRIFVGTRSAFRFSEISPKMKLGPHGQVDGLCGLVWGCHTHKED
jgi:hypothetical protein